VLFFCGVQLVLRSGVLTVLDLDEVDVTPRFAEVFKSVLSGVGGSTGGWRCCCGAPIQLPPATTKNPPPYVILLFLRFGSNGSNQHKIWTAGGKSVFIWEAGWEEPFGNNSAFSCFKNLEKGIEKENVIVPYLANLFHVALSEKRIFACWKKAKISPLYKKGSKLDPNNYRMLAVSGTLYRLYANILRELVTQWCVENQKVPDTQFGFYPNHSTIQPMFILRHLVHAAKQIKPKGCSHLHTAFIDYKQAYDTIDRPHLWDH